MSALHSNPILVPRQPAQTAPAAGMNLPATAKKFITFVVVMGVLALAFGFRHMEAPHWPQYVSYLLLSMLVSIAALWGAELLPRKPWVPAAMAGIQRLVDCLLLAVVGHVLAVLFRSLADWQQPEPEERPFRNMRLRPRSTSR